MVVYRRKKVTKYRGDSTHGGGARKKRRGAGSRGGRGNAGTGKRAGQKKAGKIMPLGKFGFLPRRTSVQKVAVINVGDLSVQKLERWMMEGKATKDGAFYVVDLGILGYDKLLGTGKINLKLKIKVAVCSASALEKVRAAGGDVGVRDKVAIA